MMGWVYNQGGKEYDVTPWEPGNLACQVYIKSKFWHIDLIQKMSDYIKLEVESTQKIYLV